MTPAVRAFVERLLQRIAALEAWVGQTLQNSSLPPSIRMRSPRRASRSRPRDAAVSRGPEARADADSVRAVRGGDFAPADRVSRLWCEAEGPRPRTVATSGLGGSPVEACGRRASTAPVDVCLRADHLRHVAGRRSPAHLGAETGGPVGDPHGPVSSVRTPHGPWPWKLCSACRAVPDWWSSNNSGPQPRCSRATTN